ncbi:MAG: sulfur reduction protein DsrJ [Gammaproteobacteria bacterium]|nr:sulfur reduction protein DsrJ [Gammaproteobacteria bacterium]
MAMRHGSIVTVALVLVFALVVLVGLNGVPDASGGEGGSEGVPMPVIPRGQGDSCVDDTEFMRRYHMTLLEHEHGEPRSQDIRSEGHRLRECVNCHAVMGPDARPVSADSPEHFCRSCHDYVAVKIDCFDCHRSRGRRAASQQPREPT